MKTQQLYSDNTDYYTKCQPLEYVCYRDADQVKTVKIERVTMAQLVEELDKRANI